MSRWRVIVVTTLIAVPFLVLIGLGGYFIWSKGWSFYLWWPLIAFPALGYLLAWYWQRKKQLLSPPDQNIPLHWTDQDRAAWKLVEARAQAGAKLDPEQLSEFTYYAKLTQEMALEMARFYHPGTSDPVGPLTLPEILTVIELAAQDLVELVNENLPGGHLLTINDWRRAKQVKEWYNTASNLYWVVAAFFSPIETGLRYAASKFSVSRPLELLQQNLIIWFYTHFVHRLGNYLIELQSGRLRVGAKRYREIMRSALAQGSGSLIVTSTESKPVAEVPARPREGDGDEIPVRQVTITIFGQVKVGKSSFINSLLGEQLAHTDVLPATGEVTRYELQPEGIPTRLVVLDTVGYAHQGPREDQLRATETAVKQSDLLVLVLHARNPARQADLDVLREVKDWFAGQPHLKMPPIVAVLTHIDLLSPAIEWAPPYDWRHPQRPKEKQIQLAVAAVRDQLGEFLTDVIPVCTAPGKIYGLTDWFLPILMQRLDEAHAVGLLRCLRAESDTGKIRKLFQQLLSASKQAALIFKESYSK